MKRFLGQMVGVWALLVAGAGQATAAPADPGKPLRVGIVGLDTSHVGAFTALLNDTQRPDHVPGATVVLAFKGGSPDVENSANRIDKFTAEVTDKWKIPLAASIEELARQVDAVLLTSVDGRTHLSQARPIFKAGKRVFIDKPLAANLADATEILRLSRESGTPFFSASSLRYTAEVQALPTDPKLGGPVLGAFTYGPAPTEPHHGDLFWYGVHSVEILYTVMGPGCVALSRTNTPGADVIVGRWSDGRLGTVRGMRDAATSYGAVAFGKKGNVFTAPGSSYRELLVQIVRFFQTGVSPVPPEETLEIMAFMQAADDSKAHGGAEVALTRAKAKTNTDRQ